MTFIRTIPPAEASGPVEAMYDNVKERWGFVPNWARTFSVRPDVHDRWAALLGSIKANMSVRRFELATLAAARALNSSYCALAHGKVLAERVFDPATVAAIAGHTGQTPLEPAERAMMAFAEKLALHADRITESDVAALRTHGLADEEIFDIAAAAAARCFFAKLLDALGVQADASFRELDPGLREALTVGRPIEDVAQSG